MNTPIRPEKKTETTGAIAKPAKTDPPTIEKVSLSPWETAIAVGGTVLATQDPTEGYFPARVVEISKDGKSLKLVWLGYPKLPAFSVRKLAVGLLAIVQ